ncbi:MAG TPA: aldo/keto reductase [Candidatus Polarisedimenticolaceae bacterium]|nr:aldo/keto reductase [Candidatus Polarisedimenticolaceae bacterium]
MNAPRATMPRFGLGTWRMGENAATRAEEIAALTLGLDLGVGLIDTAEMYGNGGAEEIVGRAIEGRRDDVYLVTKVLPGNASYAGTLAACERSLQRLRTDRIDLYLLHWPGHHPLEETLRAFVELRRRDQIVDYGVSNFDIDEMRHAVALPGGDGIASNQILYNLQRRGPERKLLPWCNAEGISIMAYSPLDQGRLVVKPALREVAVRRGVTPYQVAIAWTLVHEGVVSIPKAGKREHVRDNVAAASLLLDEDDLAALDRAYPAPARDVPLETA